MSWPSERPSPAPCRTGRMSTPSRARSPLALVAQEVPRQPQATSPRAYVRREPEKTVLHVVVREHLETFLATFRAEHGKSLPRDVEQELRRYLRCGVLAR